MPQRAQTWRMLQAIQYRIQSEVVSGSPAASPFTPFTPADAEKYGGLNPFGTITSAIHIGMPKPTNPAYTRQCHILPALNEQVYRRSFGTGNSAGSGGKVWDEQWVYVVYLYRNDRDWYQTTQDLIDIRDITHTVITKHAELPGVETVQAVKGVAQSGGMPTGFFRDQRLGLEWDCWGFIWWHKQEYTVPGAVVP